MQTQNQAVRHIVFFTFNEDMTDDEKTNFGKDLKEMISNYKSSNVIYGKNLSVYPDGNLYETVLNVEFPNAEERLSYLTGELHDKFQIKWAHRIKKVAVCMIELNN